MSEFTAAWLDLREPYDLRARNRTVTEAVVTALSGRPSVTIVDLACGTGATFRALAPHIDARQNWRLVDNDLSLLARTPRPLPPQVNVSTMPVDLNRDLEAALDGPADLVTTSALLDLVSAQWLDRLVTELAVRRLPFYAALTYDGRVELSPADPADEKMIAAVNAHQRSDKGFGPALGPTAAAAALKHFERVGYSLIQGPADWLLSAQDRQIQYEVLAGWTHAAHEIGDPPAADATEWLTRRRHFVVSGASTIRVGHLDLFARPIGMR